MNNWEITVNSPELTSNMKFLVRYRKKPDGNWVDLLPSPTTNVFTITGLDDEPYQAEIKVMCENGTISTPKLVNLNCTDDENGTPTSFLIKWSDGKSQNTCDLSTSLPTCSNSITTNNINDYVTIHLQRSTDGTNFQTIGVVDSVNHNISEAFEGLFYYRYKGTTAQNIEVLSNIITFQVIRGVAYSCETYTFTNTNPVETRCTCGPPNEDGTGEPCDADCPSGFDEYFPFQNPQTVTWTDCDTGQTMSAVLNFNETITVNRRI